jgi:hypothetical protein
VGSSRKGVRCVDRINEKCQTGAHFVPKQVREGDLAGAARRADSQTSMSYVQRVSNGIFDPCLLALMLNGHTSNSSARKPLDCKRKLARPRG